MKITVCEFPDDVAEVDRAWDHLARVLEAEPTDLLVLPELAAAGGFWTEPTFDQAVWDEAVARHALLASQLQRLAAGRVLGTRAVDQMDGD